MTDQHRQIAALIVAAGRGERAGTSGGPKQYRLLAGEPILRRTARLFLAHPSVSHLCIAIHGEDTALADAALVPLDHDRVTLIEGGATRQLSVLAGLRTLARTEPDFVLIHDAARPLLARQTLDNVIDALDAQAGIVVGLPITDTVKRTDGAGRIIATPDRRNLYRAQTPQAFSFGAILAAHESAVAAGVENLTDDAAIAERAGLAVQLIVGACANPKITFQEDIALAEQGLAAFPDIRVGNGYDVHRFEDGDGVILCGVEIPHDRKLSGHSDADVGLHALTDALLGTIGAGDIGSHFPPSEPQWRGAPSSIFVEHALKLVREKGGRVANADITLIAEEPKVGPHRPAMTSRLSQLVGIDPSRISVKATTNEKMGFVGRGEGIAAIATVSVAYPGGLPE